LLGAIKRKLPWQWTAVGKHPCAKDYFYLGSISPAVKAFEGWIEKGYHTLLTSRKGESFSNSWRFWAKGNKKGQILCGLGRDSSDSLGRPYPLLVMGNGTLVGWEKNWDLLSFVFEDTWTQMEYICTRRFSDLYQLEDVMKRIKTPTNDWSIFNARRLKADTHCISFEGRDQTFSSEVEKGLRELTAHNEFQVSIDDNNNCDSSMIAVHWNNQLKTRMKSLPLAEFLGGKPEKSYLAIFNRSLNSSDFVKLWTTF
jgi:type VI secretion system protein VasJ